MAPITPAKEFPIGCDRGIYQTGCKHKTHGPSLKLWPISTTTAGDGFIPAKKALARIYGKGLGVTQDVQKAKAVLKGLPKQESKAILAEIAGP